MAHPIVVALGRSPLGRAGLATFSILTLAAVAGGILPMTCQAGATLCSGDAPVLAAPEGLVAEAVPEPPPAAAPVAAAAPAPDAGDFLAATFATLEAGLAAAAPELTTRTVHTVDIGPDGRPAGSVPPPLTAPPPLVAEAAAATPPAHAEARPPATAPPRAEPAPRDSALAYAAGTGDSATVTGQGANVRSKPRMTGSEVLFALRGGAEVTIAGMQQGWARVVDESGRSGWIYGKYLRRQ